MLINLQKKYLTDRIFQISLPFLFLIIYEILMYKPTKKAILILYLKVTFS